MHPRRPGFVCGCAAAAAPVSVRGPWIMQTCQHCFYSVCFEWLAWFKSQLWVIYYLFYYPCHCPELCWNTLVAFPCNVFFSENAAAWVAMLMLTACSFPALCRECKWQRGSSAVDRTQTELNLNNKSKLSPERTATCQRVCSAFFLRDGSLQTTDLPLHLPCNLLPSAHNDAYGHCDSAWLRLSPGDYKLPVWNVIKSIIIIILLCENETWTVILQGGEGRGGERRRRRRGDADRWSHRSEI